ncbi:hypothetical protein RJ639_040593 [Escallonia herrerae]|uniref:DOG1 domain-containing protein n=1 Tax=Escallonia herrerae TaxID=1293975 RepID=A0AA88WLT6_9ASTE|nr:hypothetical protein RJ639_040593 [Escallonia herrerae]
MATSSGDQGQQNCCFQKWMQLQEVDLSELLQALTLSENGDRDAQLSQLVQKMIKHFEDYIQQRNRLARDEVSAYFAPRWCTSLENSMLWIAGCRPSSYIRLVYALCGSEIESRLTEFLQGARTGDLGELTSTQLSEINALQSKTIKEEEQLSGVLAGLQEDIADQPFVVIASNSSRTSEWNGDAERALDEHAKGMASMLEEADQLRLSTLKEMISILTPVQAVDFLVASKKLHLCMHAWGLKRDHRHGRE